jgi:hypothetical protein
VVGVFRVFVVRVRREVDNEDIEFWRVMDAIFIGGRING